MSPELRQEEVHQLRKNVDAVIEQVRYWVGTRPEKGGAELTLSYRKLQEGKMWLGKVLEEMGAPFPPELADKAE